MNNPAVALLGMDGTVAVTAIRAGERSANEVLAWSRELVDPALRSAVDTLPVSMRHIAGYHFGWWDEQGKAADVNGGKVIRPTMVLLAAEAMGGQAEAAVPAAVAIEMVHNFSLLHDDVMDRDLTRRHRRTAWTVFGINPAILTGDALLSLGFDLLASSGHPQSVEAVRLINAAVVDLLDGQSADIAFEDRTDVDLAECLMMAEGKTGALFGCAGMLGAIFGGAGPEQAARMRLFGVQLGLAFQLVDDLLGIWGDPGITGKPVYSDLQNRKRSLPVVSAIRSGTPAGDELAELYARPEPLAGPDLAKAAELVEAAGGRSWSQSKADELLVSGLAELAEAEPAGRSAAELSSLARLITRRDR